MNFGAPEIVLIVLASLAGLTILVGLPVWMGIRYALREREMEHAERMRALELGLLLPKDQPKWTPEKLPWSIGAAVPITALFVGLIAGHDAWVAASLVGTAGVICGTVLAMTKRFDQANAAGPMAARDIKPAIHDPDAFDVVSRRG